MGLKKGMTNNQAGRPRGTLNKLSRDMKKTIHEFLQESWPEVKTEFHKLKGRDKLNFYKDLLQYDLPKMQAVQMEADISFSNLSEQDIDAIAFKLLNANKTKK